MKKQDFYFSLPDELIAQYPLAERSSSRLLVYNRKLGNISHHQLIDLKQFLKAGDLLVMNDSKVIPARLYGHKPTGGKVELLVERLTGENILLAHIKARTTPKPKTTILLSQGWEIEIIDKQNDLYLCKLLANKSDAAKNHGPNVVATTMLNAIGHVPLPPYINRIAQNLDKERYQTVYAKHDGSVAAPTAGLHFDAHLLQQLQQLGVRLAYATLHIGAGTFKPVKCDNILEHQMHHESFSVSEELAHTVNDTRSQGHRVIAVGTTALRSLESAVENGILHPKQGDTNLFIYPGYKFKICDGLLTNFHLPGSTLIMLVSAFIGHAQAMALYQEAISKQYRFFSYGDASLLL